MLKPWTAPCLLEHTWVREENKQLQIERAGEGAHVIYHKRERRRKANYCTFGLNNERSQTKHFAHTQWQADISEDSGEKHRMHTGTRKSACTPTRTLQEMTQTSTYCSVRSINSSHWAVSAPSLSSIMSPRPFVPHPLSSSMKRGVVTCDRWSLNLVPIVLVLPAFCTTSHACAYHCPNSINSSLKASPVSLPLRMLSPHKSVISSHRKHTCAQTHSEIKTQPQVRAPCPARAARGQDLPGRGAPNSRWTKGEPNPRRALTIRLLNGPVTILNRF